MQLGGRTVEANVIRRLEGHLPFRPLTPRTPPAWEANLGWARPPLRGPVALPSRRHCGPHNCGCGCGCGAPLSEPCRNPGAGRVPPSRASCRDPYACRHAAPSRTPDPGPDSGHDRVLCPDACPRCGSCIFSRGAPQAKQCGSSGLARPQRCEARPVRRGAVTRKAGRAPPDPRHSAPERN